MYDNFGVRVGRKYVSKPLKLRTQLHEIVDFSITDHPNLPIEVRHGLVTGFQVNDGETAEPEA